VRLRFGPFTLDLATRQLRSGDREIHVSPKAFELLAKLALDRPRVLSKSDLLQHLWPDTFVAEANLSNLIAEIREVVSPVPLADGDAIRIGSVLVTFHARLPGATTETAAHR
jgi:DNA-binding winged helix-turn-helix (wHTH) protein